MTYQPRTDEDWEKLAECIVTKHPSVSPELVGGFTVDATQTIFTWYKGEERSKFLGEKHYARDRLMRLAREAGCLKEPSERVGEDVMDRQRAEELGDKMIAGTLTDDEAQELFEAQPEWVYKKEPIPVPQTYGDWVSLAMDIKQKAGIDDFETTASVNEHLENIYSEEPSAEDSKRWLVEKAGELGIQ